MHNEWDPKELVEEWNQNGRGDGDYHLGRHDWKNRAHEHMHLSPQELLDAEGS